MCQCWEQQSSNKRAFSAFRALPPRGSLKLVMNTNDGFLAASDKMLFVCSALRLPCYAFRPFFSTPQAPAVALLLCWITLAGNKVFSRLSVVRTHCLLHFTHSRETAASVKWRWTLAAPSPSESRWLYKASWRGCTLTQTVFGLALSSAGRAGTTCLAFILLQGVCVWQGLERSRLSVTAVRVASFCTASTCKCSTAPSVDAFWSQRRASGSGCTMKCALTNCTKTSAPAFALSK